MILGKFYATNIVWSIINTRALPILDVNLNGRAPILGVHQVRKPKMKVGDLSYLKLGEYLDGYLWQILNPLWGVLI